MSIYKDLDGRYMLLDYSPSHSELLLRKRIQSSNIDILFKSVRKIFLPTLLMGIEISILTGEKESMSIIDQFGFTSTGGYNVFEIKTVNNEYHYINAGVFGVFANELDILETSLGDFAWSSNNHLLLWSNDFH